MASTRQPHLLARRQPCELRLLEVGDDVELVGGHDSGKLLSRRNQVALLGRAVADDAVIRCAQDGEGKIARRLVAGKFQRLQRAFRFSILRFENADIGRGAGDLRIGADHRRIGLQHSGLGVIELRLGADFRLDELGRAFGNARRRWPRRPSPTSSELQPAARVAFAATRLRADALQASCPAWRSQPRPARARCDNRHHP